MKEGWEVEKLGDICQIELGKTPPRKSKKYWDVTKQTNNVWLSIADLSKTDGKFIFDSKEYISDSGVELSKIVKKGTLLASFKLTLGRLAFAGKNLYTNEAIAALSINNDKKLSNQFLYWYLTFFDWDAATEGDIKVKGKTLNKKKLKEIPVFIPPLSEQKRIVALLDETFAALDKAKVNAERNLVNAREVFESVLDEMFSNPKKDWKAMKLDDACIVERGSSPRPIKKYRTESEDGVNWIKIGDTKNIEKYLYTTKEKITKEGAKKSRFVKEGDFILSNSMSFGKPYILKTKGYIHDGWFVLRLKEFIDTEFFWYLLVSPFVHNQFNRLASGAIVKNISGDLVKKANLFIPPLPEQHAIVAKLDTLSAETKKLEEIYERKLVALEELRKSVLQQAFAGEL